MKTQLLTLLLAFAKCQSNQAPPICNLLNYIDYTDPECKVLKESNPAEVAQNVASFNKISQSDKCEAPADLPGVNLKVRITCMDSMSAKMEYFNMLGEDPDCQNPYPFYSDFPSIVARDQTCIKTSWDTYTLFYFDPSLDPTVVSNEPLSIPDNYSPKFEGAVRETVEWKGDNAEGASSCMLERYELFVDGECSTYPEQPFESESDRQYNLMLYMQHVMATECSYFDFENKRGLKLRMYCEDEQTLVFKQYNNFNEDPQCMRPYENTIQYKSLRAKDGDCVKLSDNVYAKLSIVPFDQSYLSMNTSNWTVSNHTTGGTYMPKGDQVFSIQTDGFSASASSSGDVMTHELKFDQYFMYGIDEVASKGSVAQICGPDVKEDLCKKTVMSQSSCCTQIISVDEATDKETSFYRCMNKQIVDHSFSFEIDGLKMTMACTDDQASGATYMLSNLLISILGLLVIAQ